MARHVWSVLCERVLIDIDGQGQVSMIDAAEEIVVEGTIPPEQPSAASVNLSLVSYWVRGNPEQPERGMTRIDVQPPAGERHSGREIAVDLETDVRVQTVGQVPQLVISGVGRYEFIVWYREDGAADWRECSRVPLDVTEYREAASPAG